MMRSRVGLGMCLAEGASFSTADTVPAESPTWAATDFNVTVFPFGSGVVFFSAIFLNAGMPVVTKGVPLYGKLGSSET